MALIPVDVGLRLRTPGDASLEPVGPVKPTVLDIPELQTGQKFTARILEVLPENTYRALVAGRNLTLSLPEGANAGDTLELVVIDRTPKMVLARTVEQPATGAAPPYAEARLSPAAQLIGSLLPREGEAPPAADLTRGQPLLPQPPKAGTDLAPALGKAVSQSGLFYEAHQAQWVAGRLPLANLLQEPQGRQPPASPPPPGGEARPQAAMAREAAAAANPQAPQAATTATGTTQAGGEARSAATQSTTTPAALPSVPDDLRPLVQQQLDAVATQRLAWHGEVWPGQNMEWEVRWERPPREDSGSAGTEADAWTTSVTLDMPRLGKVDATLRLAGGGVRVTLATPYGATAADLRDGGRSLAEALQAAGVPLTGFQVKHEQQ